MDNIKVISLDLDNTLLNADSRLSEKNRCALEAASAKGIEVVVNTGRGINGIFEDVLSVNGLRYAITSNGACIYDLQKNSRIFHNVLKPETVGKLLEIGRKFGATYEIFVEGKAYVSRKYYDNPTAFGMKEKLVPYIQSTRNPVANIEEFISNHIGEIENFAYVLKDDKMHTDVYNGVVCDCEGMFVTSSDSWWIEVMDGSCGKGKGLKNLCNYLGYEISQTCAFGDSGNDLEMLEYAGVAVCMENGSDECKRVADIIAPSNVLDGVATILYQEIINSQLF